MVCGRLFPTVKSGSSIRRLFLIRLIRLFVRLLSVFFTHGMNQIPRSYWHITFRPYQWVYDVEIILS